MLKSDYQNLNCSVARALESVGERWTLLIVRELLRRPRRFLQLERTLSISKNMLASRLEKLIQLEIVDKLPYEVARDWNTYHLTSKGKSLFPVISALMAWGDAYEAPNGPPAIFLHSCGRPGGYNSVCAACGGKVDADSITVVPGPGFVATPADSGNLSHLLGPAKSQKRSGRTVK
jgi:DNA-binding HxlR family transcriptional regulator